MKMIYIMGILFISSLILLYPQNNFLKLWVSLFLLLLSFFQKDFYHVILFIFIFLGDYFLSFHVLPIMGIICFTLVMMYMNHAKFPKYYWLIFFIPIPLFYRCILFYSFLLIYNIMNLDTYRIGLISLLISDLFIVLRYTQKSETLLFIWIFYILFLVYVSNRNFVNKINIDL